MTNLEEKFKRAVEQAQAELEPIEELIKTKLKEGIAICKKYGVPNRFPVSPIEDNYCPESYKVKWGKLISSLEEKEDDSLYELLDGLGIQGENEGYPGWWTNSTCRGGVGDEFQ